jgi:hypothetical protein
MSLVIGGQLKTSNKVPSVNMLVDENFIRAASERGGTK